MRLALLFYKDTCGTYNPVKLALCHDLGSINRASPLIVKEFIFFFSHSSTTTSRVSVHVYQIHKKVTWKGGCITMAHCFCADIAN